MSSVPCSEKVAVVPEASFLDQLPLLRAAGYGLIQLPPADLAEEVAADALEQVAEQVAEYRRNGYSVVLACDGAWVAELADALVHWGIEPLPTRCS